MASDELEMSAVPRRRQAANPQPANPQPALSNSDDDTDGITLAEALEMRFVDVMAASGLKKQVKKKGSSARVEAMTWRIEEKLLEALDEFGGLMEIEAKDPVKFPRIVPVLP